MSAPALPSHVSFPSGPAGRDCPACAGQATFLVYRVEGIPIHSCTLLDSKQQALEFPRGDMQLAACPDCGFLFNAAFDRELLDYGTDYEETQGYSGTFTTWLDGVIARLVADYGLTDKTIVEIGCGRGDFLAALCRAGNNRGIGIDPSASAGRVALAAGRGLEFQRELYGPQHAGLSPDALVCRHTLEHLPDVRAVVELVHSNLAQQPDALVFFELPDVRRELEEGAFWDIYYEHCSYFSVGSLTRLFQSAGFGVLDVGTVYADQYIHLAARQTASAAKLETALDDRAALARATASFQATCSQSITDWHELLSAAAQRGERVALWGAGSKGTGFLTTLGLPVDSSNVACVVDINPDKQGRFMAGTGQRIVAPAELPELAPDLVIAMNPIYTDEIAADLQRLGVRARLLAV